jgi:hypothetical protein
MRRYVLGGYRNLVKIGEVHCNPSFTTPENLIRIGFSIRVHASLFEVRNPYFSVIHGNVPPEMRFAIFDHYDISLLRAVVLLIYFLKIM